MEEETSGTAASKATAEDILTGITEEQLDGIRRRCVPASTASRQLNSSTMKGAKTREAAGGLKARGRQLLAEASGK